MNVFFEQEGKQRQFELGKWYRNKYNGFLSQKFNTTEFKAYTAADADRTFMSAASNLAGLYPPKGDQIWNKNIKWQPIPIYESPVSYLGADIYCHKYAQQTKDALENNQQLQKILNDNPNLLVYISNHTGDNYTDANNLSSLYDTLFVENRFNLTLPNWTKQVYPEPLKTFRQGFFQSYVTTKKQIQIAAGSFLNLVISHFEKVAANGTNNDVKKFLMYSAHDFNIVVILAAFGAYDGKLLPYFASTLVFELRQNSTDSSVHVYYKDKEDPVTVRVKDCQENCSLDDFKSKLSDVVISADSFIEYCNL